MKLGAVNMYTFPALVARMKYIGRWGLMRQLHAEDLAQHSAQTAQLAHLLGVLATKQFARTDVQPCRLATSALYHDISEILTGDMPTPVKYQNERLKIEYKKLEAVSVAQLCSLLPQNVGEEIYGYASEGFLTDYERRLLKAADKLSAYIKCIEETHAGNGDFTSALTSQKQALDEMALAEVQYFIEHMLPEFSKTLDELTLV